MQAKSILVHVKDVWGLEFDACMDSRAAVRNWLRGCHPWLPGFVNMAAARDNVHHHTRHASSTPDLRGRCCFATSLVQDIAIRSI